MTRTVLRFLLVLACVLILGDPLLMPFADVDWPFVLRDPPLVRLTTLPGLQLRPLSPKPPDRRGGSGPGG